MIPILFNKDEKTFTSLGLGQMNATLVEVERERNGNYTLYAEVPFNSSQAKYLTKEMLIKADAGARTKWQTFKINRTIKDTNADVIKVYADHISMDTINDAMNPKVVIRQQTAEGALRQWANNLVSGKAYDVQSDITHVGSTEWTIDEVENARQALGGVSGSILDVWGGEYEFDNNRIILHKEMGRTAPTVLEYGRNIVSLEYEELIDGVYTSIYPYATYTPKSEDNKQLPDIMVTLDELIVDSEYAGNYETRRIQIVDFSNEFDSNAENPEIPTQAKLRTLAKAYVKNNGYGIPKISQEIDFVDLSKTLDYQDIQVMEEIELNDRVPVYYPNIDAETNDVKVTTTNWDVLNNRYSKITLSTIGAMNTNSITSKLNTAIKDLKAEQKKINNTVPYLINGQGNRVWYTTPDDNMEHKIGDTWFKKNGKYTIILRWNGSMWEEFLNDETFIMEIEAEVGSAISKAENAQALAVSEAEKALADANKYADEQDALITQQVTTSVSNAISTADQAKQVATDSYNNAVAEAERLVGEQSTAFNTKFEANATAMSTLSQATKDADTKAQSALTKAGANANLLTTHQNTLNTINNTTIPNVNKIASDAMTEAKSALSSASSAMSEAKKADGKIADYVTRNGLVSGTTVDSKINDATGEISKKITTVEGKVDGLQVGGRNYLLDSQYLEATGGTSNHTFTVGDNGYIEINSTAVGGYINNLGFNKSKDLFNSNVEMGETYTVSFAVRSLDGAPSTIDYYDGNAFSYHRMEGEMSDKFSRFHITGVKVNSNFNMHMRFNGVGKFEIKEAKLEKGNKATDWSPAPEDNLSQSEFQIFESTYDADVKGINSTLTDLSNNKVDGTTYTNFYNNEYKQTAQGVTDTWTAVNKVIDANGNSTDAFAKAVYDKNATRQSADFKEVTKGLVKEATYTAGINGISGKITSVEGKIDGLQVGGRNLWIDSQTEISNLTSGSPSKPHYRMKNRIDIPDGQKYLSYQVFNPNNVNVTNTNQVYFYDASGKHISTTTVGISNLLIDIPTSAKQAWLGAIKPDDQTKIKYEYGNVPTDWSPAPEDMQSVAGLDENITAIYKNTSSETAKAINQTLTAYQTTTGLDSSVSSLLSNTNSQTAKGINSKLTAIEGKIPTSIGVQNLVSNSEEQTWAWASQLFTASETSKVFKPNTKYAYRWEIEIISKITVANVYHLDSRIGGYLFGSSDPSVNSDDIRQWYMNGKVGDTTIIQGSFTTGSTINTPFYVYGVRNNTTNVNSTFKVKRILIAESDVLIPDWSPAPEDMATAVKTNEIERTADYSKMAITNLSKNGVVESSSVNATKDGITERVAKVDAKGNISYSNRDVKLNSIVTSVADQKYISQQVQGSNIIQNTIAKIVPAGANLLKNSDFRDVVTGVTFYGGGVVAEHRKKNTYPAGWGGYNGGAVSDPTKNWHAFLNNTSLNFPVVEFNETDGTRHWKGISTSLSNNKYAKINPTASYIFSVDTYSNGTGTKLFGGIYYTKKGGTSQSFHAGQFTIPVTKANKWERLSAKVPLGSDVDLTKPVSFYIYGYGFKTNSYLYIKNISLTDGNITAGWSLSPEDTATQSQITQLADNINLKVSKGDISNQININAQGVVIKGNKISLSGQTSVDGAFWAKEVNAVKVKADNISGTTAQFKTMVTKGLTADVISSTMIKADTALFDMLFSTTSATTRLVARGAWITNANIVSLDASKITAGTINSARINATQIVTNGLSANVVKSTHIESSTALVDKIFANEAYIKRMTGKTAFISSVQAINISASRITSGTLDASKVTVTNLDASSITANQAELVKAGLKGSSGGTLELTGDQFLSTSSDGSQVYLQNGVMGVRRPTSEGGGSIGQIGYVYDGGSPTYTIQTSWGSHFALKQRFYDSYTKLTKDKRAMYISTGDNGVTTMQFYAKDFVLQGDRNLRFGYDHYINGIGNDLTLTGQASVTVRAKETTVFVVSSNGKNNYASMYANLNMQGNTVTNTSDIRLKRNIVNDEIDSLSALMKWQHAGFNYINPNMNQERQFSVIAQSAPDLAFAGEDGYLQVALNKQVNMTSHALQQHVIQTNDKVEQLEAKIASLQEELALLKGD